MGRNPWPLPPRPIYSHGPGLCEICGMKNDIFSIYIENEKIDACKTCHSEITCTKYHYIFFWGN